MKIDAPLRDLLIERGATEAEIKYLEHSDSVSELLSWASWREDDAGCICCDGGMVHNRDCKVFAAWHVLGMGQARGALDATHEAAIAEDSRRTYQTKLGPLLQIDPADVLRNYFEQRMFSDTNMPKTFAGRVMTLNGIVGLNAQLGEQTPLNDAPAVDDGDGLDVDDP